MAARTTVLVEDELYGGVADETVSFALDGRLFDTVLSAKNAEKIHKMSPADAAVAK